MNVYISRTGNNKLTIRKGKKLPAPDENVVSIPLSQLKSNERHANVASATGSTYNVFTGVHSWARDPSPTGESSSSSSVGGLSIGGTLLKCSISEMSPSSLVLPSPKDSGVDVNSPCHRGDEEGVMSLGGIAHVVDCEVGAMPNGVDVGSDRSRRPFVTASSDPYHRSGGQRNSSNESSRAVVKESRSKYTKLDPPGRQSSSNSLKANPLPGSQHSESPFIIKRHRDSSVRIGFNANSQDGKSFNQKSVDGSTDASSRDIYSFGGGDSITPTKLIKARKIQRPTNLPTFNDELPADSKRFEPTPTRMGFRFFSGDRRRSNVADNAAVRLLREFTGVNNGEKKGVDKKIISSDKRNNAALVVAPTTIVAPKESVRKYTLVPVAKPDANKLIIKISTTGQRGAMGTAASGQRTPVQTSTTGKFEPALSNVKRARSTNLKVKAPPLAAANKNNLKGKSKGLASRSIDRLALTDKSSVMYPGIKKLADGGSQGVAVRDPLLEATYRPSRRTILNLNTLSTSTGKDPVVLNSTSLSNSTHQSHPLVGPQSAEKSDCGNNVIKTKTEVVVETLPINSKSKQFYSAVKQLPAEKILSENLGNIAIKRKAEDAKTLLNISLKSASANLTEDTNAIVIAQTVVENANSEMKNISETVDEIETRENTAVCLNSTEQALNVASAIPEETAAVGTELEFKLGNVIPSSYDSAAIKIDELKVPPLTINNALKVDELKVPPLTINNAINVDELKVPPLTINKISLSIKRASTGSWYVPESSKERRRERKLKKREKYPSDHPDERRDFSGALHDAATEQHDPLSLGRNVDSEKHTNAEDVTSFTPNPNFTKGELPHSRTSTLRDNVIGENNSSAFPVELDNTSESRQNQVQSYSIEEEEDSVVRPEHHVRSSTDSCITPNIPDIVNAQSTSMKLTNRKKSRKHGKKNKIVVSVSPSVENLAERAAEPTTSCEVSKTETKVVCEKKTSVRLTRPWEDGTSDLSAKFTTSTSVMCEFKDESLASRFSLNNERKSALSAFSGREEGASFCSDLNDRTTGLESDNFNYSNESKKIVDPLSFVASPKIDDDGGVEAAGFVGDDVNLNPVIEKSTEKVKTLKKSSDDITSAVNGKRKCSNLSNLDEVVAKRSKLVANGVVPCSLTELINPLVSCSANKLNKLNESNSFKLNGAAVRLSNLNECTTLARGRKTKAGSKGTLAFVNTDQMSEDVVQRLKRNVTDLVDAQINPIAEKSRNSISTIHSQLSIHDDASRFSADKEQEMCPVIREAWPGVSNETLVDDPSHLSAGKEKEAGLDMSYGTIVDGSVSTKVCVENGESERQTVVKFQSELTVKVKSCVVSDDRTTLSENEVAPAETGRLTCSPLRNVSLTSLDCSQLHQQDSTASSTEANEKSNRPIRRDKSTVKRKYIKEKVQPCELTVPTCSSAITTSRSSIAVYSTRNVELPVEERVTRKILESLSGSNLLEANPCPKVQLNQNLSISADILKDRVEEESVSRKKRKDVETDNNVSAALDLDVLKAKSSDLIDAISCLGRSDMATTIDNADSYPRNRWKRSSYSFSFNDDDSDNDADVLSPCNINTPSPSSSPRSVVKDNVVSASDKDDCRLAFDNFYSEPRAIKRTSTNFEVPTLKIANEMYPSNLTTRTKKQKVSRPLSDVSVTVGSAQNDITEQKLISDQNSKVSTCYQLDMSLSLSNNCNSTMTSLETLTPPPSACESALDLSDGCGIPPTIFKDGRFSCEDESLQSDELRTSSGAVLDVAAVSEFLNVDQYSVSVSRDPIECVINGQDEKNSKELEKNEQQQERELSFSSDLNAVDTAYMDIISSLSLGDATPFLDLSCGTSRSNVGAERGPTKHSRELNANESPLTSVEKLSICRPWSDSEKAAIVKDIEELEQQSRLFDNADGENKSDSSSNVGAHCEYDPLDIDSIVRSICSGTTNEVDATVASDNKVSSEKNEEQLHLNTNRFDAGEDHRIDDNLIQSDIENLKVTEMNCPNGHVSSDLAAFESSLEPLVLSSFDPSVLCEPDKSSTTSSALTDGEMNKTHSSLADSHNVATRDLICSNNDVKEPETQIFVQDNKEEHKEVDGKGKTCVGYLGAFAQFLKCSGPVAYDQQSSSSVDTEEVKDQTCEAAILGSENARLKQPACRAVKKNKNRTFVENYCASPLSTDLEESRLFTTAGGNNQVTRRNSRIFRRSTLLKQMCRFRQETNGSGDGCSYDDEGTGTDSDHTSSKSNRSYCAAETRNKRRKSSKATNHLEQVNEEAMLDLVKYDGIDSVAQTQKVDTVESVIVASTASPVENSFVSVQLELAELESSVRLLFDVMFSGVGMGGFSIIPKIFSASVTESASSGVEQLLDAICTILGSDDANKNSDDSHAPVKSLRCNSGLSSSTPLSAADGNHRPASHSDGVIMLCNQPQSCLVRLKRKIATVLTLVLPDLALNAEEIYRTENVGELLKMVISANTDDSLRAVHRSDCSISSSFVAESAKSSSQLTTLDSSKFAQQSIVPECLESMRRLNSAGDSKNQTRLDDSVVSTEQKIPLEGIDFTRDVSDLHKSRKKRVNKNEMRKEKMLSSHSLSRVIPTEQERTTGT